MIDISKFKSKEDLFKFLKENKALLIAQKKSESKMADAFSYVRPIVPDKEDADKATSVAELLTKDTLDAEVVINTTRLLDSHQDCHIDGLWKKSLKEKKNIYLIQEHKFDFKHVIAENVKASTKVFTWGELGFKNMVGSTEALVFESKIEKSRNSFMFEQYAKGYVKNHSVGMRYVQLHMCINSEEKYYKEEKENWDKYIGYVANKEEAEQSGYFWAVTEAKIVEGSAVLAGSNWATPTIEVKEFEPSEDTQTTIEPEQSTQIEAELTTSTQKESRLDDTLSWKTLSDALKVK